MSLLCSHSVSGAGKGYPTSKPVWQIICGDDNAFEGFTDDIVFLFRDSITQQTFGCRSHEFEDWYNRDNMHVVAQRERVTSINDDRLAQDMGVNTLITERGNRYGKFKDGAEIMRDLKHVMHKVDGWNNLTPSQKEALDMIQHKIGRILNGDPTYDDSWKDIAGYATLIVEELNGVSK